MHGAQAPRLHPSNAKGEGVGGGFVEAEEEELGGRVGGVVGGEEVRFGEGVGVCADEGDDVGVGDWGELGGVFH